MTSIVSGIRWFFKVIGIAASRFWWDDCFSRASALAYSTLFALVPLSWIAFTMFTAFGIQEQDIAPAVDKILDQILPGISAEKDLKKESSGTEQQKTEEQGGESEEKVDPAIQQLSQFRAQVTNYFTAFRENVKALTALKAITIGTLIFIIIALLNTI